MPVANTDVAIRRMRVRQLGCCCVAGTRTTDVGLRLRTNQVSPTTGPQRDRMGHRPEICGSGGNQPAADGAQGPGYISPFQPRTEWKADGPQRRPECSPALAVRRWGTTDDAISRMRVRELGCCCVAGTRTTDMGLRLRTNQVSPTTGPHRDAVVIILKSADRQVVSPPPTVRGARLHFPISASDGVEGRQPPAPNAGRNVARPLPYAG